MKQEALAPYHPSEFLPGPSVGDDDASLAKAAGDIGTTIFHPVGTAKMGTASDPMAVVDERLRFYGIAGLRVADASVMPTITSGNTNTPTAMIAEKAAAMILADGLRALTWRVGSTGTRNRKPGCKLRVCVALFALRKGFPRSGCAPYANSAGSIYLALSRLPPLSTCGMFCAANSVHRKPSSNCHLLRRSVCGR